jgi:hypothetical protein
MKEYIVFYSKARDVNIEVRPMYECAGTERVKKMKEYRFLQRGEET